MAERPGECREWRSWISRTIDGEISPELEHRFREHIEECAPCAERYRQETAASERLRTLLAPGRDELIGLERRVMTAASGSRVASAVRRSPPARAALAAAAALVLAAIVWAAFRGDGDPGTGRGRAVGPPSSGTLFVIERDSRRIDPVTLGAPAPGGAVPLGMGLETRWVHRTFVETDAPRETGRSEPAVREPRWVFHLEEVETRLLELAEEPWY